MQIGETRKTAKKGQATNQVNESLTQEGADREIMACLATEIPIQVSPELDEGFEVEVPLV